MNCRDTVAGVSDSLMLLSAADPRVGRALFTLRESARYLGVRVSTLREWTRPQIDGALVTTRPGAGRSATVPFVGLVEAFVLTALRLPASRWQRSGGPSGG